MHTLERRPAAANHDYGLALSPAEANVLHERVKVSNAMHVITDYVKRSASDVFGGAYIDQARGGLVYVGFTKVPRVHLAALQKLFPYPAKLRLFPVRHTVAELARTRDDLYDAKPALAAEGIDVSATMSDVPSNVIKVVVASKDPRRTETLLRERFGTDRLRIIQGVVSVKLVSGRCGPRGCDLGERPTGPRVK